MACRKITCNGSTPVQETVPKTKEAALEKGAKILIRK
jgi:hypothetical protein